MIITEPLRRIWRRRAGTKGAGRRSRSRGLFQAGPFTYLVIIVVAILSLFPLYWAFVAATSTNAQINSPVPPLLPHASLLQNLRIAMEEQNLWRAMAASVIVSGVVTACVVFFCTLAGFAFAKLKFRFSNILLGAVIATIMIPPQLGVIPLYIYMSKLHWTGTLASVILPNVVAAFGVFFMRQYLSEGMPTELLEAGRVDGASTLRIFLRVVLPVARPAMVALALLTFITSWNDFFWPLIALGNSNSQTMQVALAGLGQRLSDGQAIAMAGAVFSIIPVIVIFLVLGRKLVGGVLQGAVKG
ncbi:MAG: carbohydrate ABC transporter permease [Micromonosporaceae bacterium]